MSDKLGVERLGSIDIMSAFNDSPAIGKNREIMPIGGKPQHELVVRHFPLGYAM